MLLIIHNTGRRSLIWGKSEFQCPEVIALCAIKNMVSGTAVIIVEIEVASGGPRGTLKSWKLNLNAKVNYALAA